MPMYKRVLLKLSGEQLSGRHDFGIDTEVVRYFAREAQKVKEVGCELVIVVGGGNVVRGAELASESGIKRATADHMGMLSGLMNGMAVTDIFESEGVKTRCMSNIFAQQVVESYSFRLAEKHLQRGRITIVSGGLGRPYFTHDSVAVNVGLELSCDVVVKATKVDGVYDRDPHKHDNAKRFDHVTFDEALRNEAIKVMDKAALGMAMEHNMPLMVLNPMTPGNLLKAVQGEAIGTRIG